MFNELIARLKQGYRTIPYPGKAPVLPQHYRGLPILDSSLCKAGCADCEKVCPTSAIQRRGSDLKLDLGRCLFCVECTRACPGGAVSFSRNFQLATRRREDLVLERQTLKLAKELDSDLKKLFGRSLRLRQVSAGGCNACEADTNVLSTVVYDLSRFGIQFVASPRHADGLLVTGPVTQNMKLALKKTYDALPAPKLVIAVGSCAISGGPFINHEETSNGVDSVLPVDLYVPGCPPHPLTILDGLLRLIGKAGKTKIPA